MDDVLIECSPGVSGDMLLGAFYDLGVPKKVIEQPLIDLGLKDLYQLDFKESKSCSIRGIKAKVEIIDCNPIKRTWRSIKELILNGHLEDNYFSVRGDLVYVNTQKKEVVIKIRFAPELNNLKNKNFKLVIKGELSLELLNSFVSLDINRDGNALNLIKYEVIEKNLSENK